MASGGPPGRTAPVENRARAGAKGREPLAACCLSACRLPSTPLATSDHVRGQGKTRIAVAGPFAGNGEGEALPRGVAFEKTARHLPVNVPAPGAACASRQPARPWEQPADGAEPVSDDPSQRGREGTVRTSASKPSRPAPQVLAASVGPQLLGPGSQARRAVDVTATRPRLPSNPCCGRAHRQVLRRLCLTTRTASDSRVSSQWQAGAAPRISGVTSSGPKDRSEFVSKRSARRSHRPRYPPTLRCGGRGHRFDVATLPSPSGRAGLRTARS